ncbi:MAG: hypothetical protein J6V22_03565, partial [Clostridia bacterium]|nr:hypothetical protein [Clostridia bacterium]
IVIFRGIDIEKIPAVCNALYDGGATWTSFGVKATGANGTNGTNGANGTHGVDGKDGENGKDGKDGENGKDGLAVAATVIGSTSFATQIGLIGYELIRRKRPNWIDAVKNFKLKEVKFPWKKS